MNPFNESDLPTEFEKELNSYYDPTLNNLIGSCFGTGQKVEVVMGQETRQGFVAKQLDNRHFLVNLDRAFNQPVHNKPWLTVCRDWAHQVAKEL